MQDTKVGIKGQVIRLQSWHTVSSINPSSFTLAKGENTQNISLELCWSDMSSRGARHEGLMAGLQSVPAFPVDFSLFGLSLTSTHWFVPGAYMCNCNAILLLTTGDDCCFTTLN